MRPSTLPVIAHLKPGAIILVRVNSPDAANTLDARLWDRNRKDVASVQLS